MNWTFWTRTLAAAPDDCELVDSLLSLYADGMASAEEAHRVETHLPGCAACRASLAWMRATQHALASRPVALPPADLCARIAGAIAASSAAPVPASFDVRRRFALRPAFAAAASVAALGVISYGLLHRPPSIAVHPVKMPQVAAVPPVHLPPPVVKTMTSPGVKPHLTPHPVAAPRPARPNPGLVARSQPDEAAPAPVVKTHTQVKTHALVKTDTRMLADAAPVLAPLKPRPSTVRKPILRSSRPEMMATTRPPVFSAAPHKAAVTRLETRKPGTVVAEAPHAQTPSAPAFIEKQPVITPDPAPTVAVARSGEGRFQTIGLIRIPVGMQKFTHATVGVAAKGATYASRTINTDSSNTLQMVGETLH